MKEPFEALKRHYEACDEAVPVRGLPNPAHVGRIRLRARFHKVIGVLAPLGLSASIGLALMAACSVAGAGTSAPSSFPIFEQQLKGAGLAKEDAIPSKPNEAGRTEENTWRA